MRTTSGTTLGFQQIPASEELLQALPRSFTPSAVREQTKAETASLKLIHWDELKDGLTAFGEKHGFDPIPDEVWAEIKKGFDAIDTSGDGAVSVEEL